MKTLRSFTGLHLKKSTAFPTSPSVKLSWKQFTSSLTWCVPSHQTPRSTWKQTIDCLRQTALSADSPKEYATKSIWRRVLRSAFLYIIIHIYHYIYKYILLYIYIYIICITIYIYIYIYIFDDIYIYGKVGDICRWWPEDSLFNSCYRGVGEGATPFPAFLQFTLDPYRIMLSVRQGGIKYHFLCMTRPGIEPRSPGPLVNTLTVMPIGYIYIYIYIMSLSLYIYIYIYI